MTRRELLAQTPTARVVADSVSPYGDRLTTMEVRLHRFVLAEFNTHRKFSRNSASSRAIPVEKRLEQVLAEPAMPLWWGENQHGMQAERQLPRSRRDEAVRAWLGARNDMVETARDLLALGLHKQLVNRLIEPWMWQTVVVSSTEWDNFFTQRCHPAAQPEMRSAAEAMRTALEKSLPRLVRLGEWHLPYVTPRDLNDFVPEKCRMLSVARCARVSTLRQSDVSSDVEKEVELYDKLRSHHPPHASPFEHVATPIEPTAESWGNFDGWRQLRHVLFSAAGAKIQ